jgi:hypothetical protein
MDSEDDDDDDETIVMTGSARKHSSFANPEQQGNDVMRRHSTLHDKENDQPDDEIEGT